MTELETLLRKGYRQPNGCLVWIYAKDRMGYGKMWFHKKVLPVHRVVAHLVYNLRLDDYHHRALHSCDNPSCFEPTHIRVGTQAANMREAIRKGRKTNHLRMGRDRKGRFIA